ncbi:carboxylesterase family protein [Nonomuraea sp. NPDC046570]|uniref:carboxylesterase/lipase family protein n=1 Tax=Nonomuraea sp. NPDC046570 TaxID=3155255 RepID=UPI0033EB0999
MNDAIVVTPQPRRYPRHLVAEARTGRYAGRMEDGVLCFRSIEYAEQPVGDLRWKAPVQLKRSDEVHEAYAYGLTSIQPWRRRWSSSSRQGEDCLTLNVFTTALAPASPKAVMVWIHGGHGQWGGSIDPLDHGDNSVRRRDDVVVVTINYRLGHLGRLDVGRLGEGYGNAGNQALLDQIAALEWIRDNIAAFGGDPGNVTILGESEGAAAVAFLLVSPPARGLFHRAVIQSGAQAYRRSNDGLTASSLAISDAVLDFLGVRTAAEAARVPETELVEAANVFERIDWLTRDGVALPYDPWAVLRDGGGARVPLMIGTNLDEEKLYGVFDDGYASFADRKLDAWRRGNIISWGWEDPLEPHERAVAEDFLELHGGTVVEALSAFVTESTERLYAHRIADLHSAHAPVFFYSWEVPSAIPDLGACHAVEIAYTLHNLDATIITGARPDPRLAAAAHDAWVNFAVNGDPGGWPAYVPGERATMRFTPEGPIAELDPRAEERRLVVPLFSPYESR